MAYTLKLSNGTILLSLPDQQSDNISTSLTLIGKNVNAYGTDLNDNFVRLMENFANVNIPNQPLVGQLWYDTLNQQIKVFTPNNEFKAVGAPIIFPTQPTTISPGDFWYDTTTQQLKFRVDSTSTVTIGPMYNSLIGKYGWINESWKTSIGSTASVLSLYSNNTLIGVASDVAFNVASTDVHYNTFKYIGQGYNAIYNTGTYETKFFGHATFAENLYDTVNNEIVTIDSILTDRITGNTLVNPLFLNSNTAPLTIGTNEDFQFYINNSTATLYIAGQNENFELKVNGGVSKPPLFHVDGQNTILGIFTSTPVTSVQVSQNISIPPVPVDVDINGNVLIQGDLIVLGTGTNIKTQDLEVVDNKILLAWTTTTYGDDNIADGGGIVLRGSVDKLIIWYKGNNSWNFSNNINLFDSTSTYKINSVDVLSNDTLQSAIKYAPGLKSIGELTSATIAGLRIYQTSSTETIIGSAIQGTGNVTIGDDNTLQVGFANQKLWNVGYPSRNYTTTSSYRAQAATVGWVQDNIDIVRNPKYALTIDATGIATSPLDPVLNEWVISMLTYLYDPNDVDFPYRAPIDSRARVLVTAFTTPSIPNVASNYFDPGVPVQVDQNGIYNAVEVIGFSNFLRVTTDIPPSTLGIHRCIKQYVVIGQYPSAVWDSYIPGSTSTNLVWTDNSW